jgi:hypothetical protein
VINPGDGTVDTNDLVSGAFTINFEPCFTTDVCLLIAENGGDFDPNTANGVTFDVTITVTSGNLWIYDHGTMVETVDGLGNAVAGGVYDLGNGVLLVTATTGSVLEFTNGTGTEITHTGSLTLNSGTGIGTQANPLDLAVTTLNAATATTGDIVINELNAITLNTITASAGAVFLSAASFADDASDATVISGTSVSLTATGAIGATGATNQIDTTTGSLTLVAGTHIFVGNTSNLTDLSITSTQAGDTDNTYTVTATGLTLALVDAGTNYTLSLDDDGLNFTFSGDEAISIGEVDVTAGAVSLTSLGSITDTDAGVSDITATTLSVNGASVNLDTTIDTLAASSAGTVDINETNDLLVDDVTANSLVLVAGGSIADTATADIVVATLADVTASTTLTIGTGTSFAAGSLNLAGTTVLVTEDDGSVLADVDATDFTLVSGGAISQTGALAVSGTASFTTGDFAITLANVANDFGTVQVVNTGAFDVAVTDANTLILGTSSAGQDLAVIVLTGDLSDSGTVTVGRNASFQTQGAGNDITLDTLAVTGTIAVSTVGAGGDATLVNAGAIDFAASTVNGALDATSTTGGISDSGALAVTGAANLDATTAGADIVLDTTDIDGTVTIANGDGNVSIVDPDALALGASTLGSGTASFTSTDISIVAAVTGTGAFTFNSMAATSGIGNAAELAALLTPPTYVIDNTELAFITSDSFTLNTTGASADLFIASTTSAATANLGDVTLATNGTTTIAGAGVGTIDLNGGGADIYTAEFAGGLSILADEGIVIDAGDATASGGSVIFGVWAQGGDLVLNGDADGNDDVNSGITVTDGGHATATEFEFVAIAIDPTFADGTVDTIGRTITIDAGANGVTDVNTVPGVNSIGLIFVADDGVTLAAGSPIDIAGRVQFIGDCGNCPTAELSPPLVTDGIGTVTINSAITTTEDGIVDSPTEENESISIVAADVVITAALDADASIRLEATPGIDVNVGTATGGFEVDNTELAFLTANEGVRVSATDGNVTMTGVTILASTNFGGGIELRASGALAGNVNVGVNDLFGGLRVQAENDASFTGALALGTGGTFDVQTENGDIVFAAASAVTGANQIFLNAGTDPVETGAITSGAGLFTLEAGTASASRRTTA